MLSMELFLGNCESSQANWPLGVADAVLGRICKKGFNSWFVECIYSFSLCRHSGFDRTCFSLPTEVTC